MKVLENAIEELKENSDLVPNIVESYVKVVGNNLIFHIQDGTVLENGINGLQITDVLKYVRAVYKGLNDNVSCKENIETLRHIDEAIFWQEKRTEDRVNREVEGTNKS